MSELTAVVLSAGSAVIATLLTLFLTPRLQHYFWKRQRREELRLATIKEINRLTSEFITNHIADPAFPPSQEFFQALQATSADLRALFSSRAWRAFKEMEIMIAPNLGGGGDRIPADFIAARDRALRVLYQEVGLLRGLSPRRVPPQRQVAPSAPPPPARVEAEVKQDQGSEERPREGG